MAKKNVNCVIKIYEDGKKKKDVFKIKNVKLETLAEIVKKYFGDEK